jgi:hypothetical protein
MMLAALVASLVLNAVLAVQMSRRPASKPAVGDSMIGKRAPEIFGHRVGGPRSRLATFGRPTIVYVISPRCGWCARNTANITALWRRRCADHDFVGLSLKEDGLPEYLSKHPLPFSVAVAESETIADYHLGVTPSTLLITPDRVVLKEWNGAWDRAVPSIRRLFDVTLPGIQGLGNEAK